jgi:hypothetical protein
MTIARPHAAGRAGKHPTPLAISRRPSLPLVRCANGYGGPTLSMSASFIASMAPFSAVSNRAITYHYQRIFHEPYKDEVRAARYAEPRRR